MLVAIAVAAAVFIYSWTTSLTVATQSHSNAAKVLYIPPQIDIAVPHYDPDTNTLTVTLTLRNRSGQDENIMDFFVPLKDSRGHIVATATVSCYLPADGICETNAVYHNITESGDYSVADSTMIHVSMNVPRVDLTILSFSNDLALSSPSDRYKDVLFTGDHNAVTINVLLDNVSDVDASGTITASGPCIDTTSAPYSLPAKQSKAFSIPINVTSASSNCTITVSATYSTNNDSISAPVYYISFCDSNDTCYNALQSAQSRDANTVVMLAADINVSSAPALEIPSGDYAGKVFFDGNGHLISTSSYPALYLSNSNNITISDANIHANNHTIGSVSSSAQFIRTNVSVSGIPFWSIYSMLL